mmetsp:Transcript_38081/g.122267  ORF Transcript_38081/g.122267 Transcript_38081/m.122267 type:complete len:129 (+) Transcript_38081:35-421(+)
MRRMRRASSLSFDLDRRLSAISPQALVLPSETSQRLGGVRGTELYSSAVVVLPTKRTPRLEIPANADSSPTVCEPPLTPRNRCLAVSEHLCDARRHCRVLSLIRAGVTSLVCWMLGAGRSGRSGRRGH